tara:strand:+ start:232 stop:1542 length:1311 start_codon:yes stop_codon:yes gene_type:complete
VHSVLSLLLAHGVGGRSDLPISEWIAAWSGAIALLLSFAALGLLWHHPKFPQALIGRLVPTPKFLTQIFLLLVRAIAMTLFLVVLTACFFGPDNTVSNIAPTTIFIIFWVGMPLSAAVLGPYWKVISPWENLGKWIDRIRPNSESVAPKWLTSGWLALVPITVFHWLELAYHHGSSPRVLGWCILIYTVLLLLMTWRWGWEETRKIEGFGVLFSLAAAISPIFVDQKNKLRIRYPFVGISSLRMTPASVAVVLAALGGTAFDGVSRTDWWLDLIVGKTGASWTLVNTLGLAWVSLIIGLAYHQASRIGSRLTSDKNFAYKLGGSLIPIFLGYDIAHYFSLLLLEGQAFKILLSDPYGQGWDIFNTASHAINWTVISTTTIGWIQIGSIVGGHLLGVLFAHDRSVELWSARTALRSQYPMLVVMVIYTIIGLVLMTG